jgi:hypothetical protein
VLLTKSVASETAGGLTRWCPTESLIVGEKDKESVRRQAGVSLYREDWAGLGDASGAEWGGELGDVGADKLVGESILLLEKGGKLAWGACQASASLGQLKAKKMMEGG